MSEFKGTTTNTPSEPAATVIEDRSWPEDYADGENQYECLCVYCERIFDGHKRRAVCRRCDKLIIQPLQQIRQAHDARVTELLEANNNAVMNRRMLQVQVDTMAAIAGARERLLREVLQDQRELFAAIKGLMPKGWGKDDTMDHMPGIRGARLAIAKVQGKL